MGSSNIDPIDRFSLLLLACRENQVVDDKRFGAALARNLRISVATASEQISAANWKRQPIGLRFVSWLCHGLLRLMTEIGGYKSKKGQIN